MFNLLLALSLLFSEPVFYAYNDCEAYVHEVYYENGIHLYGYFNLKNTATNKVEIKLTESYYIFVYINDKEKMCKLDITKETNTIKILLRSVLICYCRRTLTERLDDYFEITNEIRRVPR